MQSCSSVPLAQVQLAFHSGLHREGVICVRRLVSLNGLTQAPGVMEHDASTPPGSESLGGMPGAFIPHVLETPRWWSRSKATEQGRIAVPSLSPPGNEPCQIEPSRASPIVVPRAALEICSADVPWTALRHCARHPLGCANG